ncbi:MAG: HNH/endonuclease VII fold putative polymorphic toxin [Pseudomonas sp.]|uniref:HNH/endonuclease VII fold putative polymorphic toxin n=1 Tax=Pseudomonas sp. TaxID=306 RepID=UPI003D6E17A2
MISEKLLDGYGGYVYKNGRIAHTRDYYFLDVKGARLIIQDHSYGHSKAVPLRGAEPHFNIRPFTNPTTGNVKGTHGHYNY